MNTNNKSSDFDITKQMLNKIRISNGILKEEGEDLDINFTEGSEPEAEVEQEVSDETEFNNEGEDISEEERKSQVQSFMELVTPRTTFGDFKIYPEANNVVFNGEFDSGVKWQLSKVDGLFFNVENQELSLELIDILKRLEGFYQKWLNEWSEKLNLEYKNKLGDE